MNNRGLVLSLLALLAGCGDGEGGEHEHAEDPAEHACEHVGGAATAISASESESSALETLSVAEAPYRVELPALAAGFIALEGPLEALLFADTADVVSGLTRDGSQTELLPEPSPNEFCADALPEHFDLELEAGAHRLKLGPAAVGSVRLILSAAHGHGHD
jgi:hypothetical protein